jgi:hypothetical protein
LNESRAGMTATSYRGMTGFDAAFEQAHNPRIYAAAALAAANTPETVWGRGLTKEQRLQAANLLPQIYPGEFAAPPNRGQ